MVERRHDVVVVERRRWRQQVKMASTKQITRVAGPPQQVLEQRQRGDFCDVCASILVAIHISVNLVDDVIGGAHTAPNPNHALPSPSHRFGTQNALMFLSVKTCVYAVRHNNRSKIAFVSLYAQAGKALSHLH